MQFSVWVLMFYFDFYVKFKLFYGKMLFYRINHNFNQSLNTNDHAIHIFPFQLPDLFSTVCPNQSTLDTKES